MERLELHASAQEVDAAAAATPPPPSSTKDFKNFLDSLKGKSVGRIQLSSIATRILESSPRINQEEFVCLLRSEVCTMFNTFLFHI